MNVSAKDEELPKKEDDRALRELKHDINNQLSNILLSLEQLRYEIPDASEDCAFYLDSILISATRISALLKATE